MRVSRIGESRASVNGFPGAGGKERAWHGVAEGSDGLWRYCGGEGEAWFAPTGGWT